jgi:hypothetical protein
MTQTKLTLQHAEVVMTALIAEHGFARVLTALGNIAGEYRTRARDDLDYSAGSIYGELRDNLWRLADNATPEGL